VTYRARWDVGLAAGLSAGLLGVLLGSATVVAAGVVGLAFAAYGYATRPPDANVQVARAVSNESPAPGTDVDVTVTVRNASDGPLAELRVVDEPPEELPVVEGTPAISTSLAAGETDTVEYTVRARRGSHAFGDASVLARNVSGTVEHHRSVDLASEITCRVGLEELPLASQTTPYAGRVDADAPGEGVSFHSTRQFRPSDPMHRIDWKRYAKDRELTTVQYQETRAATVVVLVDARWEMRVARRAGEHDAAEYSAFAAARVAGVQLDASNRVGAALYGRPAYLRPGVGRDQGLRVRGFLEDALADDDEENLFDTDQVFSGNVERPTAAGDGGQAAPDGGTPVDHPTRSDDDSGPSWLNPNETRTAGGPAEWSLDWLTRRLPDEAQVVFCTPLLDDRAANAARKLDARGHAVRVVSPDVTSEETPGALVARIERRQRLRKLRAELPLVEWAPEEALAAAVDRSTEGWT
jgi:uncharacterized protein (DUF58 family)